MSEVQVRLELGRKARGQQVTGLSRNTGVTRTGSRQSREGGSREAGGGPDCRGRGQFSRGRAGRCLRVLLGRHRRPDSGAEAGAHVPHTMVTVTGGWWTL